MNNILAILLAALGVFYLGYRFYSRLIDRVFHPNEANVAPSVAHRDDVDYVPSKASVVFAHHFAAIAGAGPIIGPTIALIYGFGPCILWVVLGSILFGAVHDYAALLVSMRENGRSVAEVARRSMGNAAYALFIIFTIFMLILVNANFLSLTAVSLTSWVPVEQLDLAAGQTILRTRVNPDSGAVEGCIGGIASTSAIALTLIAPFLGFLIYRRNLNSKLAAALALAACFLSVVAGLKWPVSMTPGTWMIILTFYCVIAAGVPVWLILQPRDYANAFILFIGILALVVGIAVGGARGIAVPHSMSHVSSGVETMGLIWPTLFITVACGAISGFHALVAGGTTAKQCPSETFARRIGYGGMLLEGLLAVVVLLAIAAGLRDHDAYLSIVFPAKGTGNPVLAFALGMGTLLHLAVGIPTYLGAVFGILMVEGFVVTTLDTSVRLNRYLFEELWVILLRRVPPVVRTYWFNAALSAALMYGLAYFKGWKPIWPVFGTGNQLLAAFTLTAVTVWLVSRGARLCLVTLVPALVMASTTMFNLIYLLLKRGGFWEKRDTVLIAVDLVLFALAVGVVAVAARSFLDYRSGRRKIVVDPRLRPAATP